MALYYIAIGTATYGNAAEDLPAVVSDVAAIASTLETLGYRKADVNLPLNPSREELTRLDEWFRKREPGDDIVLYYVGHGTTLDQHYLILSGGIRLASVDLVRTFALEPRAWRILLTLDTCESGTASLDLRKHWAWFEELFRRTQANLTVLTSSRSRQEAQSGAFTPALAQALRNQDGQFGGRTQKHLFLRDLLRGIRPRLPEWQTTLVDLFPATFDGDPCWDFPNPFCTNGMPEGLSLEEQRRFVERGAHWDDRIRHFTGRARAVADIDAFLAGNRGGAMVVTGDPGSGKSSVMAHFVLAPGLIDVPIHAKGRDLAQIMEILSSATGVPLAPPVAGGDESRATKLAKDIADRAKRITIAIDALDEASKSAEIARSLLAGLAASPNVWLLIGTRPDSTKPGQPRFQALGSAAKEIDLDSSRYFAAQDLDAYAMSRLLEEGPYKGDLTLARGAGRAVAGKAGHTFLVAKLECDGLVKSPRPLAPAEIWQSELPVDIKTLFREYLDRFTDDNVRRRIESALQPLAFAFGQGLPFGMWERLAEKEDIQAALEDAGAYVAESQEGKRSVYRLFHEKFAEFFRDRTDSAEEHGRIVTALMPSDCRTADGYTRRYLALHAAEAGRLDELLESASFLVAAEPLTLRRVVAQGKSDRAVRHGHVYSVAAHLLGADLAERAALLTLAAMKFGYQDLAREFRTLGEGCGWWIRAVQWKTPTPYFVIRSEHGAVRAVAPGQRDGVGIIASGGDDGKVRLWNLETLESIGAPLELGTQSVRVEALAIKNAQLLTVTDGTFEVWNLETLQPVDVPWEHTAPISLSTLPGGCYAVAITDSSVEVRQAPEGTIVREGFSLEGASKYSHFALGERSGRMFILAGTELFDLETLNSAGNIAEPSFNAIGTGMYDGRSALVTGTSDNDVRIWDAMSLTPVTGPLQGHETYVDAVALGERNGRSVVISGSRDGSIRVWIPEPRGRASRKSPAHLDAVWSLALGETVLVSGSWDRSIRIWNPQTLEPMGEPIHEQSSGIAVGELHGRPIVVAVGEKGLILWNVESRNVVGEPSGNPARAVVLGFHGGRPVAAAGSDDASIRLWDLDKSKMVAEPIRGIKSNMSMGVCGLTIYGQPGKQRIIAAGMAASIEVWDLEALQPAGPAMKGHDSVIYELATGQLAGKPFVASASFDQTVRLWDLESFQPIGNPLRGHHDAVYAVAIGEWNGQPVIFSGGRDGTLRIWDLETHAPITVIRLDSWIYALQTRGAMVYAGCANGLAAIELR